MWIPFGQTCRVPAQYVKTKMESSCLGKHCPIKDLHESQMVLQKTFLEHSCMYAARRAGQPVPPCIVAFGDLQSVLNFPISQRLHKESAKCYKALRSIVRSASRTSAPALDPQRGAFENTMFYKGFQRGAPGIQVRRRGAPASHLGMCRQSYNECCDFARFYKGLGSIIMFW